VKLLFLTKRRPQQRDLLHRPYGRFFYLPTELAARGHEVKVMLLGHDGSPAEQRCVHDVNFSSWDARSGPQLYLQQLRSTISTFQPDWVVGNSDSYYGILARHFARRGAMRYAVDAYDNFEAYMPWNLPLHWLWRRAVAQADLVTAAGPQLASRLASHRRSRDAHVLPMAADPQFMPLDRNACRRRLGLPLDRPLIGYCGSFDSRRGSHVLLEAMAIVRREIPDAMLVLSGRQSHGMSRLPETLALGYLNDDLIPSLLNGLDVACVLLKENAFGNYSYPAKLYEAMACEVPVVASATAPVRWILGNDERFLAQPGSAEALADRIIANTRLQRVRYPPQPSWSDVARQFEALLLEAMG
jgi:glycosyltransferase involved in cell wall biosynthesis